jgi:hypothetical protein
LKKLANVNDVVNVRMDKRSRWYRGRAALQRRVTR